VSAHRSLLAVTACALLGCSSEQPTSVTVHLALTAGQELDAFSRAPSPTRLVVRAVDTSLQPIPLLDQPWHPGTVRLPEQERAQLLAFEVLGLDATDTPVLRGATIHHALWALDSDPLPVFLGRVGEMSRTANQLTIGRRGGVTGLVGARFLVVAGGESAVDADGAPVSSARFSALDLGLWQSPATTDELPRAPLSMVMNAGRFALLIDAQGANWFDFSTYAVSEVLPPEGTTFAEVAGAATIYANDGSAYIVGPARSRGDASDKVLRVSEAGQLTALRLTAARARAAATWVTDVGLLVAGGSATAPGAELLPVGMSAFVALPYPEDATQGAGAAALDADTVLLAGGQTTNGQPATPRLLAPRCGSSCSTTALTTSDAVPHLEHARLFVVSETGCVVVGEAPVDDHTTTTTVVHFEGLRSSPVATQITLREPRTDAIAARLFGRTVAILGGAGADGQPVRSVEVFVPR
jgi:hypothetical protein